MLIRDLEAVFVFSVFNKFNNNKINKDLAKHYYNYNKFCCFLLNKFNKKIYLINAILI